MIFLHTLRPLLLAVLVLLAPRIVGASDSLNLNGESFVIDQRHYVEIVNRGREPLTYTIAERGGIKFSIAIDESPHTSSISTRAKPSPTGNTLRGGPSPSAITSN